MNRKIEFRGKLSHSGAWVFGSLLKIGKSYHILRDNDMYEDGHHVCQESDCPTWVDPDTVGEFTGMKDNHGRKIFEGDVVRCRDSAFGRVDTGVVKYDYHLGAFVLEYEDYGRIYQCTFKKGFSYNDGKCTIEGTYSYEVIVNVYDNSELLSTK